MCVSVCKSHTHSWGRGGRVGIKCVGVQVVSGVKRIIECPGSRW